MVADNLKEIRLSNDPLTFVLHSIAPFGMVLGNESFITFLFVHLLVSTRSLAFLGVTALTPFRPASQL